MKNRREKRRPASPSSAVELAVAGKSTGEIAVELGVHRATVWSWLSDPVRSAQVEQTRRLAVEAVGVRLRELSHDALDTLASIMVDPVAPHVVRVRAACELLDRAGVGSTPAVKVDVTQHHSGVNVAPLLRQLCEMGRKDDRGDDDPRAEAGA